MMRKVGMLVIGAVFAVCVAPRAALADSTLQESLINVNGTQSHNTFAVPGLNAAGFNTTTGLGTLVFTFNPGAPGTYHFDAFFDLELAAPFFNEFGTVNGAPAAGQTWQIDDPATGDIFANTQNNTLSNTNFVPGTADNFGGACEVHTPGCATTNDDVSWAMGFNFTLGAPQEEVITLNLSTTPPGSGFYLGQHHPQDSNNAAQMDAYFSGQAVTMPTTTPEPSTGLLLGAGLCLLILNTLRSRVDGVLG